MDETATKGSREAWGAHFISYLAQAVQLGPAVNDGGAACRSPYPAAKWIRRPGPGQGYAPFMLVFFRWEPRPNHSPGSKSSSQHGFIQATTPGVCLLNPGPDLRGAVALAKRSNYRCFLTASHATPRCHRTTSSWESGPLPSGPTAGFLFSGTYGGQFVGADLPSAQ